ncbi:MAG: hypothetical protein JSS76_18265 [Bacteroidetes bacterium]|nr:hypothetical protein [Bacteroidota bacterium]
MKKFIFAAAVLGVFTLSSCKKDYTCECTYSVAGMSQTVSTTVHGTKSDAQAACNNVATAGGSSYSCSLK